MSFRLSNLSRLWRRPEAKPVQIIDLGSATGPVYAVGDLHGCSSLLRAALNCIQRDAEAFDGPAMVILLGDLIDRGPDSAGVLEALCCLEPETGVRTLLGNHERMMLSFAEDPSRHRDWLTQGGFETLMSYGLLLMPGELPPPKRIRQMIEAHVPDQHLHWLRTLPHGYLLRIGEQAFLFSHAGFDATLSLAAQNEATLLWGRNGAGAYPGHYVVQGHVILPRPDLSDRLIRIDTGAWNSGVLSILRLVAGHRPALLSVTEPVGIDRITKNIFAGTSFGPP